MVERAVMFVPFIDMVPDVGCCNPPNKCNNVVLPFPDEPVTSNTSPFLQEISGK
jgi:hypothetical protein